MRLYLVRLKKKEKTKYATSRKQRFCLVLIAYSLSYTEVRILMQFEFILVRADFVTFPHVVPIGSFKPDNGCYKRLFQGVRLFSASYSKQITVENYIKLQN